MSIIKILVSPYCGGQWVLWSGGIRVGWVLWSGGVRVGGLLWSWLWEGGTFGKDSLLTQNKTGRKTYKNVGCANGNDS